LLDGAGGRGYILALPSVDESKGKDGTLPVNQDPLRRGLTPAQAAAAQQPAQPQAPAPAGTMPRLHVVGVFGGLFCGYLGLSSVIPVLPRYVRETFSGADIAIGLAVAAPAFTALIMGPVARNLADRPGQPMGSRSGAP